MDAGDDETLESYGAIRATKRDGVAGRLVVMGFTLFLLCIASFATTNFLLDFFQLRPQDLPREQSTIDEAGGGSFSFRFSQLREVLLDVSGSEPMDIPNTPQMRALDWLANRDEMKLDPFSPNLVQRYVLAVLFYSTSELGWHRDLNWLTSAHECDWKGDGGVRACSPDRQVTDISLWNNLKGTIPHEIGHLTKLQVLYLARNHLRGTIPTEIGKLSELTYLGLQHNRLSGTVPSQFLGNMRNLKSIYLEKNDLTGTIRRIDPLCQLKAESRKEDQVISTGALQYVTSDCMRLVSWKKPEIACGCCTKCYAA
eukprot:CAMPEP_0116833540 /NCGR_PEP_ID=MMETSP0418-20121206/6492_1 /TAXON_ID=1158023 /ORGANISM="Astrosyne radiata, Strain 13vi08-1A" /LENGTH=311 /DNA_ID=CAMNT_0004462999 /DNA_START=224 /DNA_END=1159 /DNA_ORIENTATION=+